MPPSVTGLGTLSGAPPAALAVAQHAAASYDYVAPCSGPYADMTPYGTPLLLTPSPGSSVVSSSLHRATLPLVGVVTSCAATQPHSLLGTAPSGWGPFTSHPPAMGSFPLARASLVLAPSGPASPPASLVAPTVTALHTVPPPSTERSAFALAVGATSL